MQDIEAHLSVKSEDFSVDKLAIFIDIFTPTSQTVLAHCPINIEAAEEAANRALFAETCARLAADEKSYVDYLIMKRRASGQLHVKTVLHHKL